MVDSKRLVRIKDVELSKDVRWIDVEKHDKERTSRENVVRYNSPDGLELTLMINGEVVFNRLGKHEEMRELSRSLSWLVYEIIASKRTEQQAEPCGKQITDSEGRAYVCANKPKWHDGDHEALIDVAKDPVPDTHDLSERNELYSIGFTSPIEGIATVTWSTR